MKRVTLISAFSATDRKNCCSLLCLSHPLFPVGYSELQIPTHCIIVCDKHNAGRRKSLVSSLIRFSRLAPLEVKMFASLCCCLILSSGCCFVAQLNVFFLNINGCTPLIFTFFFVIQILLSTVAPITI